MDDGDTVHASTARRWLWWTYHEILSTIQERASRNSAEIYGLLNGDLIELDAKNRSLQLITRNQEEAKRNAIGVLEPFFEMCRGVYVMRGTEAHSGLNAQGEEAIASNFTNTIPSKETGNASRWHMQLEMDGVRLDVAHHPRGGGSGRPMNSQSGVDRIAADALFTYANAGEAPPHLVIRSHLHGYRDSRDAFRTRAIITPAMSLLTNYVYRIGVNWSEPVGAVLVYCDRGRYHVEPLTYPVRKPEWEIV